MKTEFVKPAPGQRVRQPERDFRPLPADGGRVQINSPYWKKRLKEGAIVKAAPPTSAVKSEAKKQIEAPVKSEKNGAKN